MTVKSRINVNFNSCPNCNSLNSIVYNEDRGEQTCQECGLVMEERIIDFTNGNARFYTKEEKDRRWQHGPLIPNHLSKIALPTKINLMDNREKDRFFKQQSWSNKAFENIYNALGELHRICANLELSSDIKSNAERITINALENGLASGRTIIGIVAASIFYTCKKNRNITLNEIISHIEENLRGEKSPRKHVYRCYKALFQELGLQSHTIDPVSYIPRYVSDLGIDESIVGLATKFIQEFIPHINTSGKDPKGIAAAAIYIVCKKENISIYQQKIAKIAGVTDVTLRSRMKEFYAVRSK